MPVVLKKRLTAGAVVVMSAALALAACGKDKTRESTSEPTSPPRSAPPAVNAGPVIAGASARAPEERSQPWWREVKSFQGDGDQTTDAFTIDDRAIQWRATWKCQRATFTLTPLDQSGTPLPRPLADTPNCPKDGTGFSAKPGKYTLKVTASGPWEAKVDEQVDYPLVEEPMPQMAGAKTLANGAFYNIDRTGKGTAKVLELGDGSHVLRLENFYVSINSDLELRLSELPEPRSTEESVKAPFKNLGILKATTGSMNYPIPRDVDPSRYHSIVIWCELTHNAYAGAALK